MHKLKMTVKVSKRNSLLRLDDDGRGLYQHSQCHGTVSWYDDDDDDSSVQVEDMLDKLPHVLTARTCPMILQISPYFIITISTILFIPIFAALGDRQDILSQLKSRV